MTTVPNAAVVESIRKHVEELLLKPSTPVADKDAASVANKVAHEVAPIVENATNQEDWWRSRIFLGLIAAGIGMIAGWLGLAVTDADVKQIVDIATQAITLAGLAYATWGRIVGASKPPLGQ